MQVESQFLDEKEEQDEFGLREEEEQEFDEEGDQ